MLTGALTPADARRLLAAGAGGCVLKSSPGGELARAVRAVAAGQAHLDPALAAPAAPAPALRGRESAVVRMVALGYSNKEIAARLDVGVKSIELDKGRALAKLGTRSRVDLVRYAFRHGWMTAG